MTETLTLRTGAALPVVGAGMWKVPRDQAAGVVRQAMETGYRHLDCACDYGNETEVGAGIRAALEDGVCRRDELWVTSKLWNTYHAARHVRPAVERSLRDLGLDYLDLYLVHFPIALRYVPFDLRYPPEWCFDPDARHPKMELVDIPIQETWRCMEDLRDAGLVKNIGVCNFNCALLRDLLSYAVTPPAVLQVELHPYLAQEKLLKFCRQQQIAVTGFSPLGAAAYFELGMAAEGESAMDEPLVGEIAERHARTPAQVLLRWGVQRGTAVIPKSVQAQRLRENLSIFDFELTADEMAAIAALDRGRRFNDPGDFGEPAFNTFCPIYD